MQIRVAPDPQLVVCKGNVADRVQKIKTGQSVLGWRCSRASYGTLCKILYEEGNSRFYGLKKERDAMDGKVYVTNCIDWFIKQVGTCVLLTEILTNMRLRANPYQATTQSSEPSAANALQPPNYTRHPIASSPLKSSVAM